MSAAVVDKVHQVRPDLQESQDRTATMVDLEKLDLLDLMHQNNQENHVLRTSASIVLMRLQGCQADQDQKVPEDLQVTKDRPAPLENKDREVMKDLVAKTEPADKEVNLVNQVVLVCNMRSLDRWDHQEDKVSKALRVKKDQTAGMAILVDKDRVDLLACLVLMDRTAMMVRTALKVNKVHLVRKEAVTTVHHQEPHLAIRSCQLIDLNHFIRRRLIFEIATLNFEYLPLFSFIYLSAILS